PLFRSSSATRPRTSPLARVTVARSPRSPRSLEPPPPPRQPISRAEPAARASAVTNGRGRKGVEQALLLRVYIRLLLTFIVIQRTDSRTVPTAPRKRCPSEGRCE